MLTLANEMIPSYFTRQMRKNVTEKYSLVAKMAPSVWKLLYNDLAGDNSAPPHELSKEMQERIRTILDLQDADIIVDLRINNGFHGTKFDMFWNELNEYFNEIVPAVHDRRSTSILYLPVAMSIADLKKIIIERLEKKYGTPLSSEIFIPSDEYIRLQFWPANTTTNAASKYTGRFEIKYKVQSRQLSKFHVDAHYCAALFRYMRLFAIKYRNYCSLICADDKHKVPIGEGIATSSGVRNKSSLTPANMELSSSDHDFTKLSLTPSVIFICDVPTCISESFYSGQVYVSYKNTAFQPNGGPDHRNTFGSVQISLICLFLQGDFDFLASVRTAPYHSWMNPAERVMSILNLALQGVSLQRDSMDDILEDIFKGKNTLEEIRNAAQENKKLGLELRNSIKPVQELLSERTKRLTLNERNFRIYSPASLISIDETFEAIHYIDNTLQQEETSLNSLNKHHELQNFIKSHCQIRTYSFQIKKCGKDNCKFCLPIRLPEDVFNNLNFIPDPILSTDSNHYRDFDGFYGTETKEFLPSASDSTKEIIPAGIINNNHIRRFVNCTICSKPRCIFSKNMLSDNEKTSLEILLDNVIYICGSPITPEAHNLYEKVYIRQKIHCNSPIEAVYYSCRRLKTEIICFYCGEKDGLLEPDDNLKKKFTTIYPFCQTCKNKGHNWPTRGKIKVGNGNMEPLRTNNNIGNEYQYCKGCERNLPLSVFITSKKSYKCCITCREQGKKAYQQRKQQTNAETGNQISIELNELYEFLPEILDAFEKEESENQENIGNQELAFSCTINIVTLEGNSKDRANHIIKMISDIDDYVWM
ncbi:hypothetical protein RhiirA4_547713 [Rhizophagus irregularis]|uniref:Uncharacterized protein n=1 Tax=Rhizophagus irregularis TaxID=588596 RepID=A0A2I1H3T6_9GLOM|nr:hypothetical protein RhiirA4_547713 [Rhizophagus irregularis]